MQAEGPCSECYPELVWYIPIQRSESFYSAFLPSLTTNSAASPSPPAILSADRGPWICTILFGLTLYNSWAKSNKQSPCSYPIRFTLSTYHNYVVLLRLIKVHTQQRRMATSAPVHLIHKLMTIPLQLKGI